MHRPRRQGLLAALTLLTLVATLATAVTAVSATGGLPPSFGKQCGHVNGAAWKFQGQIGTRYGVVALPAGSCAVAMRSVSGLTHQQPSTGDLGSQTLTGPHGFRCAGSGIKLAHAGFCGSGHARFLWAPQLAK